MGIEKVYMPILIVIFWIIGIVVVVFGAGVAVSVVMTGGIVVSEIFCAPRQPGTQPGTIEKMMCKTRYTAPEPSVQIDPEAKLVLENSGLRSCQARPITSRFVNKVGVKANGKRYIVFCDPYIGAPYYGNFSGCCYQD